MLMLGERFLGFKSLQLWWPSTPEDVRPYLSQSRLITVMQCSDSFADAVSPQAFRRRIFYTSLLRLSRSEDQLWSGLDSKSCRYEIKKARRLECNVLVNERQDEALQLVNESIKALNYRPPVTVEDWRHTLQLGDVFAVTHADTMIAAHVVLVDRPRRARLFLSATVDRRRHANQTAVGPLNRYLHWFEFTYYKVRGIDYYDFGGIELNTNLPIYSISRFKLSFGGEVVRENIVRLTENAGLRILLREAAWARDSVRRVRASVAGMRAGSEHNRAITVHSDGSP